MPPIEFRLDVFHHQVNESALQLELRALTQLVTTGLADLGRAINSQGMNMANEFDDLKREVGEQGSTTLQVLDVATQAVQAIADLRAQLAAGGLTAAEAAALASDLDAQQQALAAKLAELSAAISPPAVEPPAEEPPPAE